MLNDDMAIKDIRKEPMTVDEVSETEEINEMINMQNNRFSDTFKYDDRSVENFTHAGTTSDKHLTEIKTIYTSPFFLINTQKSEVSTKDDNRLESIRKIW